MAQLGYVKVNPRELEVKPPERIKVGPEAYRDFPFTLPFSPCVSRHIHNNRCNLKCIRCFSGGGSSSSELSFGELKSIFDQLERMGVLEVGMNGGEQFLYPRIHEILRDLKSRRFRKVILTNGTLLDREDTASKRV